MVSVRSLTLGVLLLLATACGIPAGSGAPTPSGQPSRDPSPAGTPPAVSSTASVAPASPPPGPARQAQTAQCGQVITADFTLANDLTCPKDALVAGADGITIDLNGKTLKGPGMGPQTWPAPQLDSVGVRVERRSGVTVKNGSTSDFSTGVYFDFVKGSTITGIRTERSRYGLYIHNSDGNTIRGNHVAVNIYGLHLQRANDNLVQGNQLVRQTYNSPGGYGIYLFASERNKIIENDIENNVNWGIWFSEAKGNLTYHNNVAGNRPQVSDNTEGNVWHDAATKRGNHWGDYRGQDTNGDGIGDGAYLILGPADVVDPYPFVERDGWKKTSLPTIDTYRPPPPKAAKEIRLVVQLSDGSIAVASPRSSTVTRADLRASSIALATDDRTLYALEGRTLTTIDLSGAAAPQRREVAVSGIVAANRDAEHAVVIGPSGGQQVSLRGGPSMDFGYIGEPRQLAPSYKHNQIFVSTPDGIDLVYLGNLGHHGRGGQVAYTIPLDGPAVGLAMNGSGTRLYVLIGDGGASGVGPTSALINVVDTEQFAVVDRIRLPGRVNAAIAIGPREDRLYVGYKGGILAIDLKDKRVAIRQEAAFIGVVIDLAVSPNGDELYAALGGLDQGIAVLRTSDLTRANIIRLDSLPTRIVAASY